VIFGAVKLELEENMKTVWTFITVLGLSLGSAMASLDPGSAIVALPPAPAFLFLAADSPVGQPDSHGPMALAKTQPAETTTPLPFAVVCGDVVLLESSTGGTGYDNWAEVIRFGNTGIGSGHGTVTLYTLQDWSGFVLNPDNVKYISEDCAGITSYRPSATVTYNVQRPLGAGIPIPEPATIIAGMLLLLPFGASTVRILRRNRVP
jgi:hypothetical protein